MNHGSRYYEYSAVLHVHSRYSDGFGTVHEILDQAQDTAVDILGLTDHDTRAAALDPGEGYYGRVMLLVGAEITPPQNHLLTWFAEDLPSKDSPWPDIVQSVADQGGLSFVAHPNDRGNLTLKLPSYRWTERETHGFTGLEVWNHLSHWSDSVGNIPSGLWNLFRPFRALRAGPRPEDLALWDRLSQDACIVGIGGTDAHAVPVPRSRWKVFPYRVSFKAIRTQIYLPEPLTHQWKTDSQLVKTAIKEGHCAIMAAHLGHEKGFRFWAEHPNQWGFMGDRIPWLPEMRLRGSSPINATWRLVKDGQPILTGAGHILDVPAKEPGCYRVELFRGKKSSAWIYSNPLYLAT